MIVCTWARRTMEPPLALEGRLPFGACLAGVPSTGFSFSPSLAEAGRAGAGESKAAWAGHLMLLSPMAMIATITTARWALVRVNRGRHDRQSPVIR
jgi:hypothetical protein